MYNLLREQLAPKGILRAGINLSNFLLVSNKDSSCKPVGISPDIAYQIAKRLEVPCELVLFERPGNIADSADRDLWDIGNIASEKSRSESIEFSNPYVLIEANFLVKAEDYFKDFSDVDRKDIKIAVSERSAYDLWLTDNIKNATLIRAASIQESHNLFFAGDADVLASLKPKLIQDVQILGGYKILDTAFTSIKQSVGVRKGKPEAVVFINQLIESLIKNNWISERLIYHGVHDKLGIPST